MKAGALLAVVALGGCMTAVGQGDQRLRVESVVPARCWVIEGGAIVGDGAPPFEVGVPKDGSVVEVGCQGGGRFGVKHVKATDRRVASFLWGGLIGESVDEANGAVWGYPRVVRWEGE